MSRTQDACYVSPAELRVGLYVHLDLSWMEHPFSTSSFKVKSADQIAIIRGLKLPRVRYSPQLSDPPSPAPATETSPPAIDAAAHAAPEAALTQAMDAKRASAARLAERQALRKACEREITEAARTLKSMSRNLHAQPTEAHRLAQGLIDGVAASMLAATDVAIHMLADKAGGEGFYHHALNVAFLSMMLAREMKAPAAAVQQVGLGALLHDIGKLDIPERVWRKTEPLSRAELAWVRQHPAGGLGVGQRMALPAEVLQVIGQHHERADGTGYPRQLKGTQISLLARIVSIANAYDNLCNPHDPARALSPFEALATMYGQHKARFDARALETFVKAMGIYPPGTLVALSDATVGLVVKTNTSRPLKPTVLVHDPDVPKEAAILLDLNEADGLSISRALKPRELREGAVDDLNPRQRITYLLRAEHQRAAA